MRIGPGLFGLWLLLAALPALAQDRPAGGVLTLDPDRLFAESAFGQRLAAEIGRASERLAAENREIETRLTAEERSLTARRTTLPPEEFRALADAFDAKVSRLRQEQDAKALALQRREEESRQNFSRRALPVLLDLTAELGAQVVLDTRAVLLSASGIEITDQALARIDAALGDGSTAPDTPDPGPDPAPPTLPKAD